ncbi:MAG: ATP-grasp domain-containing protein [Pseudomonadota bacterium]
MQWILQEFEDTHKLAAALDRLGYAYSWHKVVPFVGDLIPEPAIEDPEAVVFFGSYTLWRYARRHGFKPGVFRIRPFVHEAPWHPYFLNGADARFMTLREVPERLEDDGQLWFLRPVADSKEEPGRVRSTGEIHEIARKVLALEPDEIPLGALRHDTELMLTAPVRIEREWRFWIIQDRVVTFSLYKDGTRVVYRHEAEPEVRDFAQILADQNPGYSPAYVIDICRTAEGLRMLETNCINAAGFYAADLDELATAIDRLVEVA